MRVTGRRFSAQRAKQLSMSECLGQYADRRRLNSLYAKQPASCAPSCSMRVTLDPDLHECCVLVHPCTPRSTHRYTCIARRSRQAHPWPMA
eukprot:1907178-Alexandrium_andersonii.AAC.1